VAGNDRAYVYEDPTVVSRMLVGVALVDVAIFLFYAWVSLDVAGPGPDPNAGLVSAAVMLFILASASALLGLIWVWAVSTNAHGFGRPMRWSRFAAVFWFLVPLVMWVLPYQALAEIWDVSQDGLPRRRSKWPLMVWWGLFCAAFFVTYVTLTTSQTPVEPYLQAARGLSLAATAAAFVPVVLSVRVMQVARHAAARA